MRPPLMLLIYSVLLSKPANPENLLVKAQTSGLDSPPENAGKTVMFSLSSEFTKPVLVA